MSADDRPAVPSRPPTRVVLREPGASPATPIAAPATGRAGRYELLGEIARGGMGLVLKGRDAELGRDVALKMLRVEHAANESVLQRFVEEAQIGGQLQHPGIVPVYELGRDADGRHFFAMKLVKGRTLSALLQERPDLAADRRRCLTIFESTCQTIAYAHSRGVIHRDLKPANVMVGAFGELQVVDWGLAKVLGRTGDADARHLRDPQMSVIATVRSGSIGSQSVAGSVLGTPAYMPPEQAQGQIDLVDERGDVFALGAVLCEILTGAPPYVGDGGEVLDRAMRGDLADAFARLEKSGADSELVALAKHCLAPARDQRLRNAQEVAARITAYLAELEGRGRAALIAAADARARARGLLLLVALLLLAIVAAGGFWWQREQQRERVAIGERNLTAALESVVALRATAAAAPASDAAPWLQALSAADGARRLAETAEVPEELRQRVLAVADEVAKSSAAAQREAARLQRDLRMVERLQEIRGIEQDSVTSTVDDFAAAFRDYGIDLDALDAAAATPLVAESRIAVPLALALDYWAKLDPPREERLLAVARAADPDPWRTRLRDAKGAVALVDLAESVDVATFPEESLIALVYALSSWEAHDEAFRVAARAALLHPDNFNLQLSLADLHGRFVPPHVEESLRHATIAAALRPSSYSAWHMAGIRYAALERGADAADCFEKCVALYPDEPDARLGLAWTLTTLRRDGEALVHVDAVPERLREPVKSPLVRGIALNHLGRPAEAVESLEKALRAFGSRRDSTSVRDETRVRSQLALALWSLRRPDEARAQADQAIALDPGARAVGAFQARGLLLADAGDLAGARAALQKAVELEPGEPRTRLSQAAIERQAGDLARAIAATREAVRLEPEWGPTRAELAARLREAGELDEAITELGVATRFAPADPAPLAALGSALRARGRLRESLDALRRAEELRAKAPGSVAELSGAIADGERLLALEPRLADLLDPSRAPADARGLLDLARLARIRRLHVAASRNYARAFALEPGLAEDGVAGDRLDAARSAAQVAGKRADDGESLDDAARAPWRGQALRWLQDELLLAREAIETGSDDEVDAAAQRAALLLADPEFAPLRDTAALGALPGSTREEWSALWEEARALAGRRAGG